MNKKLLKDYFGWGFVLWLIGYTLGFVFFMIVPKETIGWYIMPIGTVIALWVLFKKVKSRNLRYYFVMAVIWTAMAIVLDYLFIVKALNSGDTYYKLDVYIYYALTFALPIIVGWKKTINQY
ncbi:MAG: hypothetical protein WCX74_03395 [Candidatus Paceibacterota bacterium]